MEREKKNAPAGRFVILTSGRTTVVTSYRTDNAWKSAGFPGCQPARSGQPSLWSCNLYSWLIFGQLILHEIRIISPSRRFRCHVKTRPEDFAAMKGRKKNVLRAIGTCARVERWRRPLDRSSKIYKIEFSTCDTSVYQIEGFECVTTLCNYLIIF